MPSLAITAKNTMLSALSVATLSLHSAYSGSGANELSGGVPAYARLPATSGSPANGTMSITVASSFDVPDAATVGWLGLWNASGTFLGMAPNGGSVPVPFAMSAAGLNTLASANHHFAIGDTLVVWAGSATGLPGTLLEGTVYYVVAADTHTLQLSATLGGIAFVYTSAGVGYLQGITLVSVVGQSTFTVSALSIDLTVAA